MLNKNSAAKGLKWSTIGTLVLTIVAILKISVLTRFLDKEDFGLIAIVIFILGFMNLFNDMGLSSAILHKFRISRKEYASLYWLNLLFSILLYIVLCFLAPLVSKFYNESVLETLIPLMGISVLLSGLGRQFRTIFQKELKLKTIAFVEIASALISFLTAVLLAFYDYGVYTLVYSAIVQYVILNITFLILGIRFRGLMFHFRFNETVPFLKIGSYQVGSQIINYFNKDLDILIVGKFFSSEILGGYSLAKQLVSRPAQILNQIISNVASPELAKNQMNLELLKKNFLKIFNGFFYVTLLSYMALFIFAPFVVFIFYGEDYSNIVILVRILSIYMLIRSVGSPIGSLIIAKGYTDLEFKWNLITLVVLPLFVIVGSRYSILFVAIFMTFGIFLLYLPGWWFLIKRMIDISFEEFLKMFSLKTFYRLIIKLLK